MASLKETKTRIVSVQSTLKITSAMKLISSAKFRQAQVAVKKTENYNKQLSSIVSGIFRGRRDLEFLYTDERPLKRIALVPFSSDSGLCGSFNSNVFREALSIIERYRNDGVEVDIYPVGGKIKKSFSGISNDLRLEGCNLIDKPSMEKCRTFSEIIMNEFASGKVDRVVFLYHRLKSSTRQVLKEDTILPYALPEKKEYEPQDLLIEPDPVHFLEAVFPQYITSKIYTAISESLVSEHAARMTSMQIATDNANDLLRELTILYNKTRQQAITTEILDIVGGRIRKG